MTVREQRAKRLDREVVAGNEGIAMIQLRQNQTHNAWLEQVPPDHALTLREWEIIGLVSHGLSNKEIARRVDLHEGTVKVHLHNIYTKIGVPNRTALALWRFRATAGSIWPVSSGATAPLRPAATN